jgi:hypothetical protein
MSLTMSQIKNVVQGISQQPPLLRFPEQLEAQENGFSTESSGLRKRPPTLHVKVLSAIYGLSPSAKALVHFIVRDEDNKYFIVFANNTATIYTLDGTQQIVTIPSDLASYLQSSSPLDDFRVLAIADYIFVVNKTKVVNLKSDVTTNAYAGQALVWITGGNYGRTYTISVDGVVQASYTTKTGQSVSDVTDIDVANIAGQLATQLVTNGFNVERADNWIRIASKTSGTFSKVSVSDGYNGSSAYASMGSVQYFSHLPATAPDGFLVYVEGDSESGNTGAYYVKYSAADNVWKETCKAGIEYIIDEKTMPHAFVRQSDGSFLFKTVDWTNRLVGDDTTNPAPSFIGYTLNDIVFQRNRLGLCSRQNCILSESANYFNFWFTTANDILDTDCIDVAINTIHADTIHNLIPFNQSLFAFTNDAQFIMGTSGTLSPKTSGLTEATNFEVSNVKPVVSGKNIYFVSERKNYSSIKEYYLLDSNAMQFDVNEISAHVPNYIPNTVTKLFSTSTENAVFVLTNGDTKSIYMYKYYFSGTQRQQSSWSKWTFDGDILGADFIDSTLYLIIARGSDVCLEKLTFMAETKDFDNEVYRALFDRKIIVNNGTYDAENEKTVFNVKAAYGYTNVSDIPQLGCVTNDGKCFMELTPDSDGNIRIDGKYDGTYVTIGEPYLFHIRLSQLYLKKQDNNGSVTSYVNGKTTVRRVILHLSDSGYIEGIISFSDGRSFTYPMTTKVLGKTVLGQIKPYTGDFKFPVNSDTKNVVIDIQTKYPQDVSIIGLDWTCNFVAKARVI